MIGHAGVIDGDTIEIREKRIRLCEIDAPESSQFYRDDDSILYKCGRLAAAALADLFDAITRQLECKPTGHDQYGRTAAICQLGVSGPDIAHWLVSNGYALDWQLYSKGNTTRLSKTPTVGCGKVVSSNLGNTEDASARAEGRPRAPTRPAPHVPKCSNSLETID
jgi:hypothetical protein